MFGHGRLAAGTCLHHRSLLFLCGGHWEQAPVLGSSQCMLRFSGIRALAASPCIQQHLGPMTKNPFQALVGVDRDAYFWIKKKLGLGEYQMGALVWLSGLIIGILLAVWIG